MKPKTYVDNSMNRSMGRVGMAHGSRPVSCSKGGGSRSYSGGGSSYSSGSSYGGGNTKTYVDNASNRSLVQEYDSFCPFVFDAFCYLILPCDYGLSQLIFL